MNNEIKDIYEVAKWFLHTQPMTHKKLQKLLYFSYGIYLAQNNLSDNDLNNQLFENNFEAWVHGPVEPKIFSIYKNNGINFLYIESIDTFTFDEKILKSLNKTIELYGDFSADELENITHMQAPWKNARKGLLPIEPSKKLLDRKDIFITFRKELLSE